MSLTLTTGQSQKKFSWATNIAVPRDARQVKQLLDGTDLRSVSDLVPMSAITETFPLNGLRFGDVAWTSQPNNDAFADYIMYNMEPAYNYPDFVRCEFFKNRTNQLNVAANSYLDERPLPWPDILKWVQLFKITSTGKYRHRYSMIKGGMFITKVQVDEFVSNIDYPDQYFEDDRPQGMPVSWFYDGASADIPECLHPKMIFPGFTEVGTVFNIDAVSAKQSSSSQVFEATSMVFWDNYIESFNVVKKTGLYYGTRLTAFPPELPPETLRS